MDCTLASNAARVMLQISMQILCHLLFQITSFDDFQSSIRSFEFKYLIFNLFCMRM